MQNLVTERLISSFFYSFTDVRRTMRGGSAGNKLPSPSFRVIGLPSNRPSSRVELYLPDYGTNKIVKYTVKWIGEQLRAERNNLGQRTPPAPVQ